MKLRSLSMRNFRRHAESDLEFPDGVTAIVGANGTGKSTLLEAISFALFGADALGTSKQLLRSDAAAPADNVSVVLQFETGNQSVEILRELRGRQQTPNAQLTIDGNVIVATGAGSSELATRKVQELLGMDREAFHTTVVARQGELSRLADAKPAERKRLVLRMLGIDRVDAAIETARANRRSSEATVAAMRTIIPDLVALRNDHAAAQTASSLAQARHAEATAHAVQGTKERVEKEGALALAQESNAKWVAAKGLLEHSKRTAVASTERHTRARQQLGETQKAAARAEELAPVAATKDALQTEWQQAQESVAKARARLLALQRIDAVRQREQSLRARLAAMPRLDIVDTAPLATVASKAQQDAAACDAACAAEAKELALLQQRAERLARLGKDAPCPTCERPLGDHADRLHASARAELSSRSDRLATLRHEAATALKTARDADATLQAARRSETLAIQANAERASLTQALAQLESDLAVATAELPADVPPPTALEELRARREAANLAYDERQRMLALAGRLAVVAQEEALALEAVATSVEAVRLADVAVQTLAGAPAQLAAAAAAVEAARGKERLAQAVLQSRQAESATALAQTAALASRIAEAERQTAELRRLEGELAEWAALAGPRGEGLLDRFRDHLVDRIGPAIQAEASRLLATFTGGRFTELLLDSDYEVFVRDGANAYTLERFSGGQQDLMHLALRLAVSRLLAQRSGSEVRLLALDEVFGSLDREHRELVVSALQGLSGIYQQVLVVSHMEALQEALDQAIVVVPDGATSRITVHSG